MNDIPGMVAKVQIIDTHYESMIERARSYFNSLFRGCTWEFLGALIEPYKYSEAMNAAPDEPESWIGEFYGMVPKPEDDD